MRISFLCYFHKDKCRHQRFIYQVGAKNFSRLLNQFCENKITQVQSAAAITSFNLNKKICSSLQSVFLLLISLNCELYLLRKLNRLMQKKTNQHYIFRTNCTNITYGMTHRYTHRRHIKINEMRDSRSVLLR